MLKLRRGTVTAVDSEDARVDRVVVEVDPGGERRPAISYPQMTGPVEPGDDVVVNVEALDLELGSGGFDVVHANLSRLEGEGLPGAHVMKLNYSSLQHAVDPIEAGLESLDLPLRAPVAVLALHGQLPCVAFAYAERGGRSLGYVQTVGGALPGWLSNTVAELLERDLLCGHITAGSCFGGEYESITVEGALDGAARKLGWDATVAGPGPGIIGSASALGHGGLSALTNAQAALALGCKLVIAPRMSSSDPRERHRGTSHHSETVLELLGRHDEVSLPEALDDGDELLDAYRSSGLPSRTMGRSIDEDPQFFAAGLAAGAMLAELA